MRRPPVAERRHIMRPQCRHFGKLMRIGADGQVSPINSVEFGRIGMDMDQYLVGMVGRDQRIPIRGRLTEPRADAQDDVRIPDPFDQFRVRAITEVARPDRRGIIDGVLPPERPCNGYPQPPREHREIMRRACVPPRAADNRDGGNSILQQRKHRFHCSAVGVLFGRIQAWTVERVDNIAQHILGQREYHRPRSPRHRDGIGARDIFGDAPRIVDPARPFAQRRKHRGEIDFLKPLAVAHAPVDVTDEQDHRLRILHRDMDADGSIGRPRPASHERHPRPPGHRPVSTGHEGNAALLSAHQCLDLWRVMQRVEDREEGFAGDRENAVASLEDELIDEDTAAGALGKRS